jgi:hypothetical protein
MKLKKKFLLFQLMAAFVCLSVNVYGAEPFTVPSNWDHYTGTESMTITARIVIDGVVQETNQLAIAAFGVENDKCYGYDFLRDFTANDAGYLCFLSVGYDPGVDPSPLNLYYIVYDNRTGIEFPITLPGVGTYLPGNQIVGDMETPVVSSSTTPLSAIALGTFTNGTVTVNGATSNVKAGTSVTLTVTPAYGYETVSVWAETATRVNLSQPLPARGTPIPSLCRFTT